MKIDLVSFSGFGGLGISCFNGVSNFKFVIMPICVSKCIETTSTCIENTLYRNHGTPTKAVHSLQKRNKFILCF